MSYIDAALSGGKWISGYEPSEKPRLGLSEELSHKIGMINPKEQERIRAQMGEYVKKWLEKHPKLAEFSEKKSPIVNGGRRTKSCRGGKLPSTTDVILNALKRQLPGTLVDPDATDAFKRLLMNQHRKRATSKSTKGGKKLKGGAVPIGALLSIGKMALDISAKRVASSIADLKNQAAELEMLRALRDSQMR